MKKRHILIFGVLAVLGVGYVTSIIPNFLHRSEWNHTVRALRGLPRERIVSAVENFVRSRKAKGQAVSETVSLHELVAGGLIRADEAAPFGDRDVTVACDISIDETRPQQILVRVPMSGGLIAVELGDGSIEQRAR